MLNSRKTMFHDEKIKRRKGQLLHIITYVNEAMPGSSQEILWSDTWKCDISQVLAEMPFTSWTADQSFTPTDGILCCIHACVIWLCGETEGDFRALFLELFPLSGFVLNICTQIRLNCDFSCLTLDPTIATFHGVMAFKRNHHMTGRLACYSFGVEWTQPDDLREVFYVLKEVFLGSEWHPASCW